MSKAPPLLPAEVLRRVLRLSHSEGTLVLAIAGALAVVSAAWGEYLGALIGVAIAGAGVFELHGSSLLKAGRPQGVNWLVGSQLYLLVIVLGYLIWPSLQAHNTELVRNFFQRVLNEPTMQAYLDTTGIPQSEMLRMYLLMYNVAKALVALLTLLYQGGMALYYHRRRGAVTAALAEQGFGEVEDGG